MPIGYNGDVITTDDIVRIEKHLPTVGSHYGRQKPSWLILRFSEKRRAASPASREELKTYYEALLESYCVAFGNIKNARDANERVLVLSA